MQTIVVDGRRWDVEFAGFSAPLRAHGPGLAQPTADTSELSLPPWTCARHLQALREHLRLGRGGLELDTEGYADAVLELAIMQTTTQHSDPEGRQLGARRSLALWWASGIEPGEELHTLPQPSPARPDREGWVGLGGGHSAQLRAWTWGERLAAQRQHLRRGGADREGAAEGREGALDFEPVAYLETMVQTCLVGLIGSRAEPPRLEGLDARATRRLLAAVAAVNHPEGELDPLADISPELAAATLRLCATLGWTPERVLATPAVEVQRLLALLDKIGGEGGGLRSRTAAPASLGDRRTTPRRSALADHPDAVVLVFGDQGGQS